MSRTNLEKAREKEEERRKRDKKVVGKGRGEKGGRGRQGRVRRDGERDGGREEEKGKI